MKIYNTLTQKKEDFKPQTEGEVKMYTCGVTVYDDSHIGHARSLYIFEVIRIYLKYKGYKVKFIRNITDIDDKIINRSKELNLDWTRVVDRYIESYCNDLSSFGIDKADEEPRATENIPDMIHYIGELINKGYAYETSSGVYFKVRKFKNYGKLSKQNTEEMLKGVRIEHDEQKEDKLDFALWKRAKDNEPYWDSPWGRGRPGWHIECSVMSMKYLGDTLDIHGGGMDLVFPHHENEIAQSEALTIKPFANYWLHHGLLTIEGQKMSKSLGNFITIKNLLSKYSPDVLKFFFLQTHYSHPIDFSPVIIEEKRKALWSIIRFLTNIKREEDNNFAVKFKIRDMNDKLSRDLCKEIDRYISKFDKAMEDDFNTPMALSYIFAIVNLCDGIWFYDTYRRDEHLPVLDYAKAAVKKLGSIFALSLNEFSRVIPKEEIETKINLRNKLRKEKMFIEADGIRKELSNKGINLEDTKEGTVWEYNGNDFGVLL